MNLPISQPGCKAKCSVDPKKNSAMAENLPNGKGEGNLLRSQAERPTGVHLLREPHLNKGMAFTLRERQILGIQGLLPPCVITPEQQMKRVMANFHRWTNDLDKYIYLMSLQDRNEKLFYRALTENVELMMPIVYTPTVGLACQKFGLTFRKPRGLYITIHDLGHVYDILCNWPRSDVNCIVVTDGERILGLGDLGAYGMGIPVGKLALYTALAGVNPGQCLPITIDVGTNRQSLIDDPLYIGLRHDRVRGEKYDALIDEFMKAVVKRFGTSCLVQFEDFGNLNAFRLLEKYRPDYCTFNDDIQGTASVALAGVIASMRIKKTKMSENVFLFQGAGEANLGIASLICMAMVEEGLSLEEARKRIFLVDSRGLIVKDRPKGGINHEKAPFAQEHAPVDDLGDVVKTIKPSVLIGAAAIPGAFTPEILKDMAKFNEKPVIFALSNPTSQAECTAEQAYKATEGRCIFASGSPFAAVSLNGKTFHPGQGNNAYIFPGVGLGLIGAGVRSVGDDIFLVAAQELASLVTPADLEQGRVYPPLSDIRKVSTAIAVKVLNYAYEKGIATTLPRPADSLSFIKSLQYTTEYDSFEPTTWDWPSEALH